VSAALLDCPCAHGRSVKLASGVRPTKTFLTDTARRWKGHVRPWKNKPDWRAVQLGIPAPETARKLPPPAAALLPAHNSAGATTVRCVNRGEEQPTRARQTSHVVVHGPLVSAAGGGGAIVQERAGYAGAAGAKQMACRRRPAQWVPDGRSSSCCCPSFRRVLGAARVQRLLLYPLGLGAPGRWRSDAPLAAGRRRSAAAQRQRPKLLLRCSCGPRSGSAEQQHFGHARSRSFFCHVHVHYAHVCTVGSILDPGSAVVQNTHLCNVMSG
jgi:hypothetical protein